MNVESPTRKVSRARDHIKSLDLCATGYTGDKANFVVDESDGTKKFRVVNAPPIDIAILVGEVLYQLRSALDHLAFELVKSNRTGVTLPSGWEGKCRLPLLATIPRQGIPVSPKFFEASLPGIDMAAFVIVEKLQPYNGGNGPTQLGWINKLANIDKHRHLHIVAPQAYQTEHIQSAFLDSEVIERLQDGAELKFPLHSPEELLDAVYTNRGIAYPFVSFDERVLPQELADVPIDNVLSLCADTVENIVIPSFQSLV
jgi:hypothetical protein